ncbi:MAG: ABC transporter ATP-binding protein [bacterium]
MQPLVQIQNLSVVFDTEDGPLTAVDDLSIELRRGEVLGLVGESGCGKSVTALALMRLLPRPPARILSGSIRFGGVDLLALPVEQLRALRGRRLSMIFQEPMNALSPLQRVGNQLSETILLHDPSVSRAQARIRAGDWLRKVGMPDPELRLDDYPHQLSGGMRQRVMIAMALMLHPDVVIADEPTTALDVTVQSQILDLLRAMRERDTAVLFITHDLGVVWEMCDRVAVMYAARIVEEAPRATIFARPCHPYTRGLLRSAVSLTRRDATLTTIDGQVPSALNYPSGCRFAPRCPYAQPHCRQAIPPLEPVGEDHKVACWRWAESGC